MGGGGASALNKISSLPYQFKLRFQCLFTNQSFCWTWTRFIPFLRNVFWVGGGGVDERYVFMFIILWLSSFLL